MMNRNCRFFKLGVAFLLFAISLFAQDGQEEPFKWRVGEELFYKVKYSFLTVGSLHFQVLSLDTLDGRPVYHCRMHMKSSPAIPFVSLDDTYESLIDEEAYTHAFWALEKEGGDYLYTRYDFDYAAGQIKIHMEKRSKKDTVAVLDSVAMLTEKVQDGLSLLYYARARCKNRDPRDVPVFTFNAHRTTFINFTGSKDDVKAKGKKVDGYYLDGKMKFVGIAGIKEDFKGWFSPDAQRIPLQAKMKAFIGSVGLNLDWWRGWEGDSLLDGKGRRDELSSAADSTGDN